MEDVAYKYAPSAIPIYLSKFLYLNKSKYILTQLQRFLQNHIQFNVPLPSNHNNNNTNDVKNIVHVSFSSLSLDRIIFNLQVNLDELVKSREMAFFENLHIIITVGYKAAFGKF